MSGIAGIYFRDGRTVERTDLERMVEILAHRGPDGSGIWSDGSVGLAHRMLWTTPESLHERLPLVSRSGQLAITADARLDNRADLIGQLGLAGPAAREIPDSALILAAYEKWGEQCPERLLGDFAFVIWDGRTKSLFCARDHVGVKPLYYYASERIFVFATEIKALLCISGVPRRLNELRVADYLVPQHYDKQSTLYEDILRVPPAHHLTVGRERFESPQYWALDSTHKLHLKSDDEYAEGLREIFEEAVRCRMRSAFPAGSMLSGGLDSSAITCMARKLYDSGACSDVARPTDGQGRWPCFSTVHSVVKECDETSYIKAVLARGGYEPHFFDADQTGPLDDVDNVLWHQDEAIPAGNLYSNWNLYRAANARGVRVILDGYDGDTAISHGLGYFRELALAGRWLSLSMEVAPYAMKIGEPWAGALWAWAWAYGLNPLIERHRALRVARRGVQVIRPPGPAAARVAWDAGIHPDFKRRTNLDERRHAVRGTPPLTEQALHYQRLASAGDPYTLELLDRAGAAFAIELRFPFRDKRLLEYCLALPPEQKICRGWTRMVMRRAMHGILPTEIQWRGGKVDMHPSFEHGLATFERERIEDVILSDPTAIEAYVDLARLRASYEKLIAREARADDANGVWRVVYLALWLRQSGLAH